MTTTDHTLSGRISFWQLLTDYKYKTDKTDEIKKIEIPIIQRDYAQGREDKEYGKIKIIRDEILENILQSLEEKIDLDFDFIYGKVDDGILHPLDGQQRLTTLFLLHWYLAAKDNAIDEQNSEMLHKFSYKTRVSSQEFCTALVDHATDNSIDFTQDTISKSIKNANWFFVSWEHDPTIQAMLVMLDSISTTFKKSTGFFDILTGQTCPITFQFIPLDNFGLSDDLYIKMNARGKLLTDFENFKAKFGQLLDRVHVDFKTEFSNKIEKEWGDFFWDYRQHDVIDTPFMRFFWFITEMLYYYQHEQSDGSSRFLYKENTPIINYQLIDTVYKERQQNIRRLFDILDCMSVIDSHEWQKITEKIPYTHDTDSILTRCLYDNSFGMREKIILFSIIEYYRRECVQNVDDDNLFDFIRVVSNFLQYVRQQKSNSFTPDLVVTSLHQYLHSICDNFISSDNIYKILHTKTLKVTGQNFTEAYEYEKGKAHCIIHNPQWKPLIHEMECYPYFEGLCFNILYPDDLKKTKRYFALVQEVWGKSKEQKISLTRAIMQAWLSVVDYKLTLHPWQNIYCFCGKNTDWNFILTNHHDEKIKKHIAIFLDAYSKVTHAPVENILKNLTAMYVNNAQSVHDWRWYFVKYGFIGFVDSFDEKRAIFCINTHDIRALLGSHFRGYQFHPYIFYVAEYIKKILAERKKSVNITWEVERNGWGIGREILPLELLCTADENTYIYMHFKEDGWRVETSSVQIPPAINASYTLLLDENREDEHNPNTHVYCLKEKNGHDCIEGAIEFLTNIIDAPDS